MMQTEASANRYNAIVRKIFLDRYDKGTKEIFFSRDDLVETAKLLNIELPKNLGDILYSVRYRSGMPEEVLATERDGLKWIIDGVGRSKYAFRLVKINRIVPQESKLTIPIPDATPEILREHRLSDEQALLAVVRYNRLLDIFLGIATYPLQSHLRSTISNGSQIEIDELYVGVDKRGCHYVIPVQAKGGNDEISSVQALQDIRWCGEKFEGLRCRAISAQFMTDERIALFELTIQDGNIAVVEEQHYVLVPASELDRERYTNYIQ